jgi:hypothetical protein
VCVCVCARARARVRACVCVCARALLSVWMGACIVPRHAHSTCDEVQFRVKAFVFREQVAVGTSAMRSCEARRDATISATAARCPEARATLKRSRAMFIELRSRSPASSAGRAVAVVQNVVTEACVSSSVEQ